jgi:regulator of cell morphogenesis and NO signaling
MENIDDMTVAEVVANNIKTADVFKKNGIDFCCGGNIKVNEVCEKKNVNYEAL